MQDFEFNKIAYDKAHEWVQHYSNLIFRVRISVFTLSVIIMALLLGFTGQIGSDSANDAARGYISDPLLIKAVLAFTYSLLLSVFFNYESGYYARLISAVCAARVIEQRYKTQGTCGNYETNDHFRIMSLYLVLAVMFLAVFINFGLGVNWNLAVMIFFSILSLLILFLVAKKRRGLSCG